MRLDKFLAQSAGLSRSQARAAIKAGRVSSSGKAIHAIDANTDAFDELTLDGKPLCLAADLHLMLNKPAGYLTAARDSRTRTVMDLLPESAIKRKCMPIGRLDKDTEGLLLFTTDGELAHRLLAPRRAIAKEYQALVDGKLNDSHVAAFAQGLALTDFTALPARLQILETREIQTGVWNSLALVSITEGKHRQVRRMFGSLGHEVLSLKRLSFGPLRLDQALAPGQHRELSAAEYEQLKEAVALA